MYEKISFLEDKLSKNPNTIWVLKALYKEFKNLGDEDSMRNIRDQLYIMGIDVEPRAATAAAAAAAAAAAPETPLAADGPHYNDADSDEISSPGSPGSLGCDEQVPPTQPSPTQPWPTQA